MRRSTSRAIADERSQVGAARSKARRTCAGSKPAGRVAIESRLLRRASVSLRGTDAELGEQRPVARRLGIARGEQLVAVEVGIGAGEEAERLDRLGHVG